MAIAGTGTREGTPQLPPRKGKRERRCPLPKIRLQPTGRSKSRTQLFGVRSLQGTGGSEPPRTLGCAHELKSQEGKPVCQKDLEALGGPKLQP